MYSILYPRTATITCSACLPSGLSNPDLECLRLLLDTFFCLLVCECSSAVGVCLEREVNMAKKERIDYSGREMGSQGERKIARVSEARRVFWPNTPTRLSAHPRAQGTFFRYNATAQITEVLHGYCHYVPPPPRTDRPDGAVTTLCRGS